MVGEQKESDKHEPGHSKGQGFLSGNRGSDCWKYSHLTVLSNLLILANTFPKQPFYGRYKQVGVVEPETRAIPNQ
jgi:hypothetical protein